MPTRQDPPGTVRYQIVLRPEQRQKIKQLAYNAGFPNVKAYILHKLGLEENGKRSK